MIPNRDSIPQNQPKPKDTVSKTVGAAESIGGIDEDFVLSAVAKEPSIVFVLLFPWACIIAVPPITSNAIASNSEELMTPVKLLFFITMILFVCLNLKYKDFSHNVGACREDFGI